MNGLIALIVAHQVTSTIVACWVFSAGVGAMPTPAATSGPFYVWTFNFLHVVTAGIARLVATKFPGSSLGQALSGATPPK